MRLGHHQSTEQELRDELKALTDQIQDGSLTVADAKRLQAIRRDLRIIESAKRGENRW